MALCHVLQNDEMLILILMNVHGCAVAMIHDDLKHRMSAVCHLRDTLSRCDVGPLALISLIDWKSFGEFFLHCHVSLPVFK
jgi:hypothetical protein